MNRYALCVGINDYPGTGADLSGCLNDANDWGDALAERGYDVATYLDADATRASILAQLGELVAKARYQDRIVFTFSGHGSWIPDRDGDEADGRDEVLLLHDYADGGLLTDDDLHAVFAKARFGVQTTIISDSCHSGTVHRALAVIPAVTARPRFLPPAAFLDGQALAAARRVAALPTRGVSRPGPVLLAGCADREYSYDAWFQGRPRGAFTAAALDALTLQPRTMRAWHQSIRRTLPNSAYPQSPALGATLWQQRRKPLA